MKYGLIKALAVLLVLTLGYVPALAQQDAEYLPGTYTAQAKGFGGTVTVTLTVDGNSITAAEATGDQETAGIGSKAIESLPDAIIAASNADVDGVAGATFTSDAIRLAAEKCLNEASLQQTKETASASFIPGTYTGKGRGFTSTVTVEAEFSDSAIISAKVVDHKETAHLAEIPVELIPAQVIQYQSLQVDAVTGATGVSGGMIAAITDCVRQAGGEDAVSIMKKTEFAIPVKNDAELIVDVAIVGGGLSGLSASVQVMNAGASVAILEASARLGGAGELCGGGSMCFGTAQQDDPNLEIVETGKHLDILGVEGGDQSIEGIADTLVSRFTELTAYKADYVLVRKYLQNIGNAFNTMIDRYDWELTYKDELQVNGKPIFAVIPSKGTRFNGVIEDLKAYGAQIFTDTRAAQLLTDESGAVCGVVGTRKDGSRVTIHAKSVLVATGGFSANKQMMSEYIADYKDTFQNEHLSTSDGAGITMCWDVGAGVGATGVHGHNEVMNYALHPLGYDVTSAKDSVVKLAYTPLLWVTEAGKRFCDETICSHHTAEGAMMIVHGKRYSIIDQATVDSIAAEGCKLAPWRGSQFKDVPQETLQAELDDIVSLGYAWKADTVEELALDAGINAKNLTETVEAYNHSVETGVDELYGKTSLVYDVSEGPFYAIEVLPRLLGTFGGLKMSDQLEVCDEKEVAIPGLYASGLDAAEWFGSVYPDITGTTISWALTSGYIAGINAARKFGKRRAAN